MMPAVQEGRREGKLAAGGVTDDLRIRGTGDGGRRPAQPSLPSRHGTTSQWKRQQQLPNDFAPPQLSSSPPSVSLSSHRKHPRGSQGVEGTSRTLPSERGSGAHEQNHHEHYHASGVSDDAMRAFKDAMELIDPKVKAGYAQAQVNCPQCVLVHECCPCHFLAACQLNPWDAAARMCSYWTERIDLFGQHRAFEALTLGSDVASPTGLIPEDVTLFHKGTMMVLPADKHGRSVIYYDDSDLDPDMVENVKSRLRVLWYIFQAAYTSGEAMGHHVVVFIGCHFPPLTGMYGSATWRFSKGCRTFPTTLPIVLDSIHLLTLSSRTGSGLLVKFVFAAALEMVGNYLSALVRVHHGESKPGTSDPIQADREAQDSLLGQLRLLGFTKKGLPEFAGGLFRTTDDFLTWARRRRRIEQKVFWTDAQRTQLKRDVNKVHSRQKRLRRTLEMEELKAEAHTLEIANVQARVEGDRLEGLVADAHAVVERLKRGEECDVNVGCRERTSATSPTVRFGHFHGPEAAAEPLDEVNMMASLEPDPIAPSCVPYATPNDSMLSWSGGQTILAADQSLFVTDDYSGASVEAYSPLIPGDTGIPAYSSSAVLPDSLPAEEHNVQLAKLRELQRHAASLRLRPPYDPPYSSSYWSTAVASDPLELLLRSSQSTDSADRTDIPSTMFLPSAFRHRYPAGMSSITSFFLPHRGLPALTDSRTDPAADRDDTFVGRTGPR